MHQPIRIDLHTHTNNSDGLFTVPALVARAAQKNIKLLALTDHDTMVGVPDFLKLCRAHHIQAIPGVEMSTKYADLELHILALNPHKNLGAFNAHLDAQIKKRKERAAQVVKKLTKAGFILPHTLKNSLLCLHNIGKPHIARTFLQVAYNKRLLQNAYKCPATVNDFIQHILDKPGQAGYIAKERISTERAIAIIHSTGGMAVLAHPQFDLPTNRSRKQCCSDLKSMGLDGLEAVNSRRHLEQRAEFAKLAVHYGWFMTAGSDTHNTLRLGVRVSYNMYDALVRIFF